MARPLDWRRVETALCAVAAAYGYTLICNNDSGDTLAEGAFMVPDSDTFDDLNLTEFAKDLTKELER